MKRLFFIINFFYNSRITKGTNLPLDTSKVDGVDNPLMHHQGNKVSIQMYTVKIVTFEDLSIHL